jgi:trans-aconitate 2-methyltransferase
MDGQTNAKQQQWNAEDYSKNSSAQLQWAQELIAKLCLNGHESLVDIGCGDGKVTAQLARLLACGNVMGFDASAGMIELARINFPPAQYPNLVFQRMNAADFELPKVFDIAFSNATLHWIKDHPSVLRKTHQCLRSGGKLLFQMGGKGNASELMSIVHAVTDQPSWREYFSNFRSPYYFYGTEEYNAWLPACGFRVGQLKLVPKDMQHNGKDGLKGWLRTTWFPYTDCVPGELRESFLDEVVETYTKEHPVDNEDNTHVKMVRLEVEAYVL